MYESGHNYHYLGIWPLWTIYQGYTCEKTTRIKWKFNFRDNRCETYVFGWANSSFPMIWYTKRVIIAKKYRFIVVFRHFSKKMPIFLEICTLRPPMVEAKYWKWAKTIVIFGISTQKMPKIKAVQKFFDLLPPLLAGMGDSHWKKLNYGGKSTTLRIVNLDSGFNW